MNFAKAIASIRAPFSLKSLEDMGSRMGNKQKGALDARTAATMKKAVPSNKNYKGQTGSKKV